MFSCRRILLSILILLGVIVSFVSIASAQQQAPPGSEVPGISDTAAIIIGTVLSLLVIYAIVAAHLRKED